MLNMGWDGDRCFVMYGFVKRAQPCHSSPVLRRGLPIKTVQGTRDRAFLMAVRTCDKSGSMLSNQFVWQFLYGSQAALPYSRIGLTKVNLGSYQNNSTSASPPLKGLVPKHTTENWAIEIIVG